MKITHIDFKNYKGFSEISFPLKFRSLNTIEDLAKNISKEKIAIFIGDNGSGKSTLLNGIRYLLRTTIYTLVKQKKENLEDRDHKIDTDHLELGIKLESDYDVAIGGLVTPNQFNIQVQRFLDQSKEYVSDEIKSLKEYLKNWSYGEQGDLPIFAFYGPNRNFHSQKRKDIWTTNQRINTYLNALEEENNFSDFEDWMITEQADENNQKITLNDLSYENKRVSNIRKALELFFSALDTATFGKVSVGKPPYSRREEQLMMLIEKNGTAMPVKHLSDGERMLIHLVGDLARRCTLASSGSAISELSFIGCKGIVLIDEIALHLHPKWQKNVIPALISVFPGIQFIITTHSPLVLSQMDKNFVYKIDNFEVSQENLFTEGRTIDHILYDVQGVDTTRTDTEELKDLFYTHIDNNELSEAKTLLTKIQHQFGINDPDYKEMERDFTFAKLENSQK